MAADYPAPFPDNQLASLAANPIPMSTPTVNDYQYKQWKDRYGFRLLEDANIRRAYADALDEGFVQGMNLRFNSSNYKDLDFIVEKAADWFRCNGDEKWLERTLRYRKTFISLSRDT
jgi:hypothetical protein